MRYVQYLALGLLSIIISQLIFQVSFISAQSVTEGCLSYQSSTQTIQLKCGSATLSSMNRILNSNEALQEESDRVWLLNADLIIGKDASLDLSSGDIDWLKLINPHAITNFGSLTIDSIKITSWDAKMGSYATTDGNVPRSFIVTREGASGKMDITNSEIAYLGYKPPNKQGLAYYGGEGSVVVNNNIHHMWYGFYSDAVGFLKVRHNIVHDITGGIGIFCSFGCHNILMENNSVDNVNNVGLMLSRESINSVIRNNVIQNSGQNGGGVTVDASSNNQVYNNTIIEGRFGIKISNYAHDNLVYDNTVSNAFDYGICILDNSTSNTVRNNQLTNVAQYGICALRGSSENDVAHNVVSKSGLYGIYIKDSDSINNTFSNNSVSDTGQDGVRISNNTKSKFISNSVIDSTKFDYSLTNAEANLVNTTFYSTHFEGIAGPSEGNRINITNSGDNRLVISNTKYDNVVRGNNTLSLNFALKDAETAVLTTVPFSVVPHLTENTTISFMEGTIGNNAVQLSWIAKNQSPNDITVVHHLENFKPGINVKVLESNTETVGEKTIGSDGIFEFTLIQKPGETRYSIVSQGSSASNDSSHNPQQYASVKTYGCELYGERVHCDQTLNHFTSNTVDGNFKLVTPLSSNSVFVQGKYGSAVKMDAKYRESVEISNSQSIGTKQFSFSFFVRNSDVAELYGHIVSHVNFAHDAGWFVEAIGNNKTPHPTQTLTFSVANTEGTLFSPPPVNIAEERFVQISGTFDGSFVKIYADGVLQGQVKFVGKYDPNPGTPMRIGSASYSTSTNRWSGIIDEFMIFNNTLTDEQIRNLPNALNEGTRRSDQGGIDIMGYWPFEGNVKDASNQGRDGTTTTLLASMAFAPDGRLFFSEKNTGEIKIMRNEVILDQPFATLPDVYVNWEQGLLGLTLDSHFNENHYVYQYYSYKAKDGQIYNKIVRFTDVNDKGTEMKVLLDGIPAVEGYHSGGALTFGPDDKLYVTVGDATYHEFALDPNILIGKVLRINRDGTIPSDNPNPTSPIFTKGHRNMYGIAFDSNGTGIITENGDALYDEINVLHKGGNYGFPILQPANQSPYLADGSKSILPIRSYYVTIAPTQAIYYTGDKVPQLKGKFLVGTFTGDIYALTIDKATKMLIQEEKVSLHPTLFTPVIGIAQAPNGDIYYGSYSIFKLQSLDLSSKVQDYYPVDVAASAGIVVTDLSFDQNAKKLIVEINASSPGSTQHSVVTSEDTEPNASSARSLTVTIPKAFMDDVRAVTDDSNAQLLFTVSSGGQVSSSGGFYNVTIPLDNAVGKNHIAISSVRVIPEFSLTQGFLATSVAMVIVVIFALVALNPSRRSTLGPGKFFFN